MRWMIKNFSFQLFCSYFMEQNFKLIGTHDWPSVGNSCVFLCFERFYKFLCEKLVAKHHLKIDFLNSRAGVLGFSLLHLSFASIIKFIRIVDLRKKFVYIYSKNSVSGCVSEKKITGGIIYFCCVMSVFCPF